mmetsp:Transcript_112624/g.357932  ORF Transcript_112624/g.357932 Transcript_112624/m.357932 type:complete len:637 (-) Transcript_112624:183-2093(-)
MYGHIHVIWKDMVLTMDGPEAWAQILLEAGIWDEAEVLDTVTQRDDLTFALFEGTCKVLAMPMDDALRAFGRHFVSFTLRSGNGAFLRSQGVTLPAFLENVNATHNYFERDHPNAKFPFVESKYDPVEDTVHLTYFSVRQGVSPLLLGVIEEVGARLYGLNVYFVPTAVPADLADAAAANRAAAWHVSWKNRPGGCKEDDPAMDKVRPPPPRISFPTLHNSLTQFMQFMRSNKLCLPLCTTDAGGAAEMAAVEAADEIMEMSRRPSSEGSEDAEGVIMTRSSTKKLSEVANRGEQSLEDVLLRATHAKSVAAAWSDTHLPECRLFWSNSKGRAEHYDLSADACQVDVFISHCWSPPENWKIVMGPDVNYAVVKSAAVAVMAKDISIARNDLQSWGHVLLWIDKACIPQDHDMLKSACINLIENFIRRSDNVCVILTWTYMERLWCVYEWACVLKDKPPERCFLQIETFMNEQTLPLYLDCIRYFSIKRARCFLESDREILTNKIDSTYVSHEAFETLVKATAVALIARSMAFRGGRSRSLHNTFFTPWADLALELGFGELAAALRTCSASEWRQAAAVRSPTHRDELMKATVSDVGQKVAPVQGVSAKDYHGHINHWFNSSVSPLLGKIRLEALIT